MKFNTNLHNALKSYVMNALLFRKRGKNGNMCVRKTLYKIQVRKDL